MEIEHLPPDCAHSTERFWHRLTELAQRWLAAQGLLSRDAVLLLPFAQHLVLARRAWMRSGRWQPRIETTHSLASALRPAGLASGMQLSGDAAIDRLSADRLLAGQSWAQALQRSDPRAYRLALGHLVDAAQAFARHAHSLDPQNRDSFWARAREALAGQGAGVTERALAAVALEWAAADERSPATDALFELRPSAWIHLQAGGRDPLSEALLKHALEQGIPVLRLQADAALEQLYADPMALPLRGQVLEWVCDDFETLAQGAAAAVLEQLAAGAAPVALIAQDRVLVRRVRALLDRQRISIADETGWTLATTPEAAQLLALLRCAGPQASVDEWLAFLKTELAGPLRQAAGSGAMAALESACRQRGWSRARQVQAQRLSDGAARLWRSGQQLVAALQAEDRSRRPLEAWIAVLKALLEAIAAPQWLEQREAGAALLDALWLRRQAWPDSAHEWALKTSELTLREFVDWVDACLEAAQFVPESGGEVQVLITPMARAMLRPFGAIVLPGAEAGNLGSVTAPLALLPDPLAQQLGMSSLQERRDAMAAAFVQLLRAPRLLLMRRSHQGTEALPASPLLERLQGARERAGLARLSLWQDARVARSPVLQPQSRPAAFAPAWLPERLSASAVESLRNCPYQFFARSVLRLREEAELEAELDRRDYGSWLHAVLYVFHERCLKEPQLRETPEPLLREIAQQQAQALELSDDEFLPFAAGLERFLPRYLSWLQAHEAQDWRYARGELERSVQAWPDQPILRDVQLQGRLDRVDQGAGGLLLIDYKAGSAQRWQEKLRQPLEDTQLAVYAALMASEAAGQGIEATYLALEDGKGVVEVPHANVAESARLLLEGLAQDLTAVHAGAALPALGEGQACEFCEMRGLCRRDDWRESAA